MTERQSRLQRLHELLADRATQGLTAPEAQELESLRRELPDVDVEALDRCAAVIDLALERDGETLPETLRQKVGRDALGWIAARKRPSASAPARRRPLNTLPWLLAAAGLMLAVVAWWPQPQPRTGPDPAAPRVALLGNAPDAQVVPWGSNTAGITGDVVWSNQRQEGYVRIAGLGANDPSVVQYQVWIFDGKREGLNAVSGGVFDIGAGGEVIVPIDAGVKVFQPTLFAVTTEPPGGVVQHDPKRDPDKYKIILAAPVGS